MKINDVVIGAKLLCLILFSDETHLTENGKHKSYPLNLSLGNILQVIFYLTIFHYFSFFFFRKC